MTQGEQRDALPGYGPNKALMPCQCKRSREVLLSAPLMNSSHNYIKIVPAYRSRMSKRKFRPWKQYLAKAEIHD